MADRRDGGNGIEALHRMIAYVREEAARLHIADVALLLEHAQEALTAFAPATPLAENGFGLADRAESRIEH